MLFNRSLIVSMTPEAVRSNRERRTRRGTQGEVLAVVVSTPKPHPIGYSAGRIRIDSSPYIDSLASSLYQSIRNSRRDTSLHEDEHLTSGGPWISLQDRSQDSHGCEVPRARRREPDIRIFDVLQNVLCLVTCRVAGSVCLRRVQNVRILLRLPIGAAVTPQTSEFCAVHYSTKVIARRRGVYSVAMRVAAYASNPVNTLPVSRNNQSHNNCTVILAFRLTWDTIYGGDCVKDCTQGEIRKTM